MRLCLLISLTLGPLAALASTWYASPDPLPDAQRVYGGDYCRSRMAAGTLADAVGLANLDGGPGEVVLLDGTYRADWASEGLRVEVARLTVRSESGDAARCILDGGGLLGDRRAFNFAVAAQGASRHVVSNITFRSFHLSHSGGSAVPRKGGALRFAPGAAAEIAGCVFLACGVGTPGDSSCPNAALDYNDSADNSSGGAVYAWTAPLTVRGCRFDGCFAAGTGAAVCLRGPGSEFADCVFEDNVSSNTVGDVAYYSGILSNFNSSDPCVASNCVFRGNRCCSGRETRGGAALNVRTRGCRFEDNVCLGGCPSRPIGGQGASVYCSATDAAARRLFDHIGDVYSNSCRTGADAVVKSELSGGTFVRCRVLDTAADGAMAASAVFYNCLIQGCAYSGYQGDGYWCCTFADCRNLRAWNASWFGECVLVNCAMLECTCGSGYLIGWNNGPYGYAAGSLAMTNTVYAGAAYSDWAEASLGNIRYDALAASSFSCYDPASTTDPWMPDRHSPLFDGGILLEGMDDPESPLSLDLLGHPRVAFGAPDIGCYEYSVRDGIVFRIR